MVAFETFKMSCTRMVAASPGTAAQMGDCAGARVPASTVPMRTVSAHRIVRNAVDLITDMDLPNGVESAGGTAALLIEKGLRSDCKQTCRVDDAGQSERPD